MLTALVSPVDLSVYAELAEIPEAEIDVAVERAADAKEALRLANDSPFRLQGSVFRRSLKWALRFSRDFDVRYAIEELSQVKFTGLCFDN